MPLLSGISKSMEQELKNFTVLDYSTPLFKLSEAVKIMGINGSTRLTPKDVSNWDTRGLLQPAKPSQSRRNKLYSPENIVKGKVINHLSNSNSFTTAASIGSVVAKRGEKLITEGFECLENREFNKLIFFFYTINQEQANGILVKRPQIIKLLNQENHLYRPIGSEQRILAADLIILAVLIGVIKTKNTLSNNGE
ncbi:MAG: MerR family transcriptional regulator [Desulfobacteraceae bacterium]|nr:MerR family transcriptional regulator [Desulfobacteraceae bacterium]